MNRLDELKESIKVSTYQESWIVSSDLSDRSFEYSNIDFKSALNYKLYSFLREMQSLEWKSFCFGKQRVYNSVLAAKEQLTEISINGYYLETLQPLKELSDIKTLSFSNNHLLALGDLALFPKLKTAELSSNKLDSINLMPKMDGLESLVISYNDLKKVYGLKNVSNLLFLNISNNQQLDFNSIPRLEKLSTLVADNINISDFKSLKRLPSLIDLSISNSISVNKNLLPSLPNLQRLNMSDNLITYKDTGLFEQLANYKNLAYLNLSDNHLENVYPLTFYAERSKSNVVVNRFEPKIPALKSLNLSRNLLHSIDGLFQYKELEELYLTGNTITFGTSLENFKNLKVLYIENCGLKDIAFLKNETQLEVLAIEMNNIVDYSPLYSLKSLKTLYVGAVSQVELNKLTKALPTTKIFSSIINANDNR